MMTLQQDQNEAIEKMRKELDEFVYIASHDLQEPLRKIAAFGERLGRDTSSFSEDQRLYLNRMMNATGRMQDMLDGLLMYSRASRQLPDFVKTDLHVVFSAVIEGMKGEISQKQARVELDTLPVIDAAPAQMSQLFHHLLSNSLKFTEKDGVPEIKIYAENPEETKAENQSASTVVICLADKGIGFEKENAERIFQPFQRLRGRSEYPGAGMGLAISRLIVSAHGGTIQAFSQPGEGTTIRIELPVSRTPV